MSEYSIVNKIGLNEVFSNAFIAYKNLSINFLRLALIPSILIASESGEKIGGIWQALLPAVTAGAGIIAVDGIGKLIYNTGETRVAIAEKELKTLAQEQYPSYFRQENLN